LGLDTPIHLRALRCRDRHLHADMRYREGLGELGHHVPVEMPVVGTLRSLDTPVSSELRPVEPAERLIVIMCGNLRREGVVDGEAPLPTGQPRERLRRVPGVLPSRLLARPDNKEEVANQSNEHQESRSDAADEDTKQPPQDDLAFRQGPGRRSARAKLPILPG
jgi:hypothetical protein